MDKEQFFQQLGPNRGWIEELYRQYVNNPTSVSNDWQGVFNNLKSNGNGTGYAGLGAGSVIDENYNLLQENVFRLVSSYRRFGHLKAQINPLSQGVVSLPKVPQLDVEEYGFTDEQMGLEVLCNGFQGNAKVPLSDLINSLEKVYCGSIGFEFEHILDSEVRNWLSEQIENRFEEVVDTAEEKKARLEKLISAEVFEDGLHKTYIGQKRFSLEGGETLIPILASVLKKSSSLAVEEIVVGMAHRGRLNVLRNVLNMPLKDILYEFDGNELTAELGAGDVKYHLGFESTHQFPSGENLKLSLAPNPSHLEFVYPVVQGISSAKQKRDYGSDETKLLPILLHGDAAFIGQGVVVEALNFSQVNGYSTGGSLHIVINNQIGFTTTSDEARSANYCTAFAKAIDAPILHINSEDVDAACWAAELASAYRQKFKKDIILDLYCYRKHGHNEGDDPSFTQPDLYKGVKQKGLISEIYSERLVADKTLEVAEVKAIREGLKDAFKSEQEVKRPTADIGEACPVHGRLTVCNIETAVPADNLNQLIEQSMQLPDGFTIYPKLKKILERRQKAVADGNEIDWGTAEYLGFSSLIQDKVNIRLSGQDCGRGTFSHRHIMINDHVTGEHYLTLTPTCEETGAQFEVYNSTLSEAAVLGFEFGYAAADKDSLVIWEAQFGDFANGAQVIIDQFVSSSEEKWEQMSGVAMFLPHGFEGQGPEHSSARLERFLQLCANGNMTVCYPTTAAQCFHMIRRHGLSRIKRPLVVMTPKSLLRAKFACSEIADLTDASFKNIIVNDFGVGKTKKAKEKTKLVFTSGKVYYDLEARLAEVKQANVRVVRMEQLYPFPQDEIKEAIKDLSVDECIWLQEEPMNMGAWLYIAPHITDKLELDTDYVGRDASSTPATGSAKRHAMEQEEIIDDLLGYL